MNFLATLVVFLCVVEISFSARVLTSPIVTNWGTWGDMERCPTGSKVISVQIKTEVWDAWDPLVDDTCLNAIKFICGDPKTGFISKEIISKEGDFGKWGSLIHCDGDGFVVGFMLRVEEEGTPLVDETASNNLRILCSGNSNGFLELDGEGWGQWTNPRVCENGEYICGLQTQVEDYQGWWTDDTSLNNIRVECCDL